MWVEILLFICFCVLLSYSATLLVKSLVKISKWLKISEYLVGFILMALATSLPELFVGIQASLRGTPVLSLGNVLGSNIADICLVGSIIILLARGIKIKSKQIKKDSLWMLLLSALPIVLFFVGNCLSRIDGFILLGTWLLYFRHLLREAKKRKKPYEENKGKPWEPVVYSALFVIAFLLLLFSAEWVIKYANKISALLNLNPLLVGIFFIAIGTSLPELVFESRAIMLKHKELALGDLLGSVITNSTLVLGLTALIMPIYANFFYFLLSSLFMFIMVFLWVTFIESESKLGIKEGIALLLLYIFFIIVEFYLRGLIS